MKDLNELLRALYEGDRDKEIHLNKDLNPLQVRDIYGQNLGQFVKNNYNILDPASMSPEDEKLYADLLEAGHEKRRPVTPNFKKIKELFKDQENLKNTKIITDKDGLDKLGARASYNYGTNEVSIHPNTFTDRYKMDGDISDVLHEFKHGTEFQGKKDNIDKHLIESMIDTNKTKDLNSFYKLKGLSNAENVLENHHIGDSIFEREGLMRLLKGKKLSTLMPLLKATGVGAMGLAAAGIGNKAMAGDFGGAGLEAADMVTDHVPGIGQIKDAIRPTELGAEPTDPVSMKGSVFENDVVNKYVSPEEEAKKRRFNLLRQKLGE